VDLIRENGRWVEPAASAEEPVLTGAER
jgi:hypothetical protein